MTMYTHTLTPTEEACGVTLDDVERELSRGMFRTIDGTELFIVPNVGPALAGSVARAAFAGSPIKFSHMTPAGPAYTRDF